MAVAAADNLQWRQNFDRYKSESGLLFNHHFGGHEGRAIPKAGRLPGSFIGRPAHRKRLIARINCSTDNTRTLLHISTQTQPRLSTHRKAQKAQSDLNTVALTPRPLPFTHPAPSQTERSARRFANWRQNNLRRRRARPPSSHAEPDMPSRTCHVSRTYHCVCVRVCACACVFVWLTCWLRAARPWAVRRCARGGVWSPIHTDSDTTHTGTYRYQRAHA